jgi:adenylate cyclase, class 2
MQGRRTNREIEIKLRVADPAALVRTLHRLGAKPRGRILEQNTLFVTSECDFRHSGRLLRLRIEAPMPQGRRHNRRISISAPSAARRAILTSKAAPFGMRPSRFKERLERETLIHDPARWTASLAALGLRPTFRYEKYRSSFRLQGLHLDLDETPVGVFLELEGTPDRIDRLARTLGFSHRDYIRNTYWDLYTADCRRQGRKPRNMLF